MKPSGLDRFLAGAGLPAITTLPPLPPLQLPASRLLRGVVLGFVLAAAPAQAFDFNDLEHLERAEQDELLEKARQAARSWNFSSARSYLDQARQKSYAPKQVKAVEALIARNEAAKEEKDRREEEARQARLAAESRQRETASGGSSSGGGCANTWRILSQEQGTGAWRDTTKYSIECSCVGLRLVTHHLSSTGSGGYYSYYMSNAGSNFKTLHEAAVATCR